MESLGTTKSRRDAPPAFSNEASPAGMKTPGSRSSSIKNWILLPKVGGEIETSLLKSPTIAIHNRKKWGDEDQDISGNEHSDIAQKQFIVNKQEVYFKLFKGIFQIGDEADLANDQKQAEHLWCLGY